MWLIRECLGIDLADGGAGRGLGAPAGWPPKRKLFGQMSRLESVGRGGGAGRSGCGPRPAFSRVPPQTASVAWLAKIDSLPLPLMLILCSVGISFFFSSTKISRVALFLKITVIIIRLA